MVNKSMFRLVCKKSKSNAPQLLGLMLLLVVGVGFYITLFTITWGYENAAKQYLIDHAYADVTIHGAFDYEHVRMVSELEGIVLAQGRNVRDFREGEQIFRIISLTNGINIPFIYEGRRPYNAHEMMILKRNAQAMGLSLGDSLTLGGKTLVITGLAASPEYIYLVQNTRNLMAQPNRFGVVFVADGFFEAGYNEMVLLTSGNAPIHEIMAVSGAISLVLQSEQTNYRQYLDQADKLRSFAYIFPAVFAVLIAMVTYVMLSRTIQKDRKQIGTMKAIGVPNAKIIAIYLSQFCFAALVGAFVGGLGAVALSDIIIATFSGIFEVPTLRFTFFPTLWLSAFAISLLLCMFSGLVALSKILPLLPAQAMRPRVPKGRRSAIEQVNFLWQRLSFNTRYVLKSTLRNKGRFFAVLLGMCGACALLVFSLGFHNSIFSTQDRYFNGFANYDVIITIPPTPLAASSPALAKMDASGRALVMPVDILGARYTLTIVEDGFDMLNIPQAALGSGVIIPQFFADEWRVDVGDILQINGYDAVVSAIIPQFVALTIFAGFDYIGEILHNMPPVYNTVYGRSQDMAGLTAYLIQNRIDFSTIDDDRAIFYSVMETMSVLIMLLIACAIILGFTVLYAVGVINLSAREYEYMFMGVMGYSHKSILLAHMKETTLQLIFALPLGFLLGHVLLESIRGQFSGENVVISTAIFPLSYFLAAAMVVGVTAVMVLVTSRHIKKLDIVEGLKVQDD